MVSHNGPNSQRLRELERQNLELRYHNLKLLEHLESRYPDGADAVIFIQVKSPGEQHG